MNKWNWQLRDNGHHKTIQRSQYNHIIKSITIYLHLEIAQRIGLDLTNQVDHKDRDIFNNKRGNLRSATRSQQKANGNIYKNNTSGYKGVSFDYRRQKYRSRISVNKIEIYLGTFDDPENAAKAYDKAAKEYFGEFASLNFPEE